jgi:hypothetical protein
MSAPWWMSRRKSGSTAFGQPQSSSATFERSEQLMRLAYELLDAHADTERLTRPPHSELLWHAHLSYLRDLQRVAREVLANVTQDARD